MPVAVLTELHAYDGSIKPSGSHSSGFLDYDYITDTSPLDSTGSEMHIGATTTMGSDHWVGGDGGAEGVSDFLQLEMTVAYITANIPANAVISSIFAEFSLQWAVSGLSDLTPNPPFSPVTPIETPSALSRLDLFNETITFNDFSASSLELFSHSHEFVTGGPVTRSFLLQTSVRQFKWTASGNRGLSATIVEPGASFHAVDEHTPEQWDLLVTYTIAYTIPPVQIDITPDFGPLAGGTPVVITGTDFVATPTVTFDGVPATGVVWISSTEIHCTTPAHAEGAVSVVVTNPDLGECTVPMLYSYTTQPVSPPIQLNVTTAIGTRSGPTSGGTTVIITGTRFQPGCTVTFGGVSALSVTWLSDAMLRVVTPPHAAGDVPIVVTNPDTGVCTLALDFTYVRRAIIIKLTSSPPWETVDQWALHRLDLNWRKEGPSGGNG